MPYIGYSAERWPAQRIVEKVDEGHLEYVIGRM